MRPWCISRESMPSLYRTRAVACETTDADPSRPSAANCCASAGRAYGTRSCVAQATLRALIARPQADHDQAARRGARRMEAIVSVGRLHLEARVAVEQLQLAREVHVALEVAEPAVGVV